MQCRECGHTNVPGSLFCERCGADLAPGGEELSTSSIETASERACAACKHVNPPDSRYCEACGRALENEPQAPRRTAPVPPVAPPPKAAEPPPAPPPGPPDDELPPRQVETGEPSAPVDRESGGSSPGQLVTGPRVGQVKLVVEQGMVVGKQFLLAAEELLVGREDAADSIFPDIDLSGLDEGYVHRRHALLTFEGSFLFVTHLGGHNRTYVNNRPIADRLPHPLNIGDTVRFGKVVLRVTEA